MPDYLSPVARLLCRAYRVISYDQRGGGLSTCHNKKFGPSEHLTDLLSVAEELGLNKFHLFGHSWGGLLAQLFAQLCPGRIKSLFLCNPMTGVGQDFHRMLKLLLDYHRRADGPRGRARIDMGMLFIWLPGPLGDWGARVLYRQIWRNYNQGGDGALTEKPGWLNRVNRLAVRQALLALGRTDRGLLDPPRFGTELPVMVIFGSHDVFGEEHRRVFRRYPWARREILPNCGHLPWRQNESDFQRVLAQFYGI
jgi:proline iminopeptidase